MFWLYNEKEILFTNMANDKISKFYKVKEKQTKQNTNSSDF